MEIHIIGTAVQSQAQRHGDDTDSVAVKELLTTCVVTNTKDPLIGVQEQDEANEGQVTLAWKLDISLGVSRSLASSFNDPTDQDLVRPRARLQNPFLAFTARASLKSREEAHVDTRAQDYLPSLTPSGINILQPLNNDPSFTDIKPRLSSLRVSRVTPTTPSAKRDSQPLRTDSKHLLPIGPASSTRIRFLSPSTIDGQTSIDCSLDFSVSPLVSSSIILEQVKLDLECGDIETLGGPEDLGAMPLSCKPRDEISYLYRLRCGHIDTTSPAQTLLSQYLEVTTICSVVLSDHCRPRIVTKWKTSVDFSIPSEPLAGNTERPTVKRNLPSNTPMAVRPESPSFKPDALPVMESPTPSSDIGLKTTFGITVTVTGPETVYQGQEFRWQILVLNKSKKQRRLGLVVIPKRRRLEMKKISTRPSSAGAKKHEDMADPIVDENIIHALQKSAIIEPTELVCLSSDIRIG